jgi:hypothetical protein
MPTGGDYQRLKTVLIESSAATEEAEKGDEAAYREVERQQSIRSLAAVITFLNLDPELRAAGALALLSRVHHTLHDLQSGARPAAANPSAKPSDGRPTGVIGDRVRAILAVALDLLVTEGEIETDQAAAWLAGEASKKGVRCSDGSTVTARQLARWLQDMRCGAAPKASRQSYQELTESLRQVRAKVRVWPPAARHDEAQRAARRTLLNLGNLAPHDAPAARR